MTRPLIERRCQLCKHYEPSKSVDYAGVCRSFAIYDEEMLVHRDSWCGRWADRDDYGTPRPAGSKRGFMNKHSGRNGGI